jgi:hypothetical protein
LTSGSVQWLGRILALPDVGEERGEVVRRRIQAQQRQLGEDAGEVALRIDGVALGAGDEGPEAGVVGGRGVRAGEEPVFPVMLSSA